MSEFLRGGDVECLLANSLKNKVSAFNLIQIALHAARGMAYLHDQGLVHKDMKTANLMLDSKVDDTHRFKCKVADFGCTQLNKTSKYKPNTKHYATNDKGLEITSEMISKASSRKELNQLKSVEEFKFKRSSFDDNNATSNNNGANGANGANEDAMGGTALYLPPEVQLPNEEYEEHGDVFAFGIVLGELITGRAPYSNTGLSGDQVIFRVGTSGLRPIVPNSNDVPDVNSPLYPVYQLATQCWLPK